MWSSLKVKHITKKCPRCGTIKASSEFNKSNSSKDGLQSYCRVCTKEYNTIWQKTEAGKTNNTEVLPVVEEGFDSTNKGWYTLKEVGKALKITVRSVRKRKARENWQQRIDKHTKRAEVYVDLDQLIARKPPLDEKQQAPEVQLPDETLPLEVELATLRERNMHLDEKVQEQKDYIVKLEEHIDSLETSVKPKGFFRRMFK